MRAPSSILDTLLERRIGIMVLLGFSSGLPLPLVSGTLQAWYTAAGISLAAIGSLSLVQAPYVFKFLWAPLLDRFEPLAMGRRRGWMIVMQLALLIAIASMSRVDASAQAQLLWSLAFLVAVLSATQDIAVDAYRTDVLPAQQRGAGVAVFLTGYRIAVLVAGAAALILSDHVGWQTTYVLMAALMGVGVLGTLAAPRPDFVTAAPRSLAEAVIEPLRDLLSRPGISPMLALIVVYKLADAGAVSLTTTFLIRGLGFTATEVGVVNKGLGLGALLGGMVLGGLLMARLRLATALLVFGVLQAVTNLGFMALATLGKSTEGLAIVVILENLASGMGTVAFIALLMALCDHRYTAFQYALLSALASIPRVLIGPPAAQLVELFGWAEFFLITVAAAVPGLALVWLLRRELAAVERPVPHQ